MRHSVLQKGSHDVHPGFQRIHLDSVPWIFCVVKEGDILDAGFKMRVRHPNYCEASSHPSQLPPACEQDQRRRRRWSCFGLGENAHMRRTQLLRLLETNGSSDLLLGNKRDQTGLDPKVTVNWSGTTLMTN